MPGSMSSLRAPRISYRERCIASMVTEDAVWPAEGGKSSAL